jgi:sulfate permease, SulP family
MSETVETQPLGARALKSELAELGIAALPSQIVVYEIVGPMFFGAVENFRRPLLEMTPCPKTLIIRLDRVPFMDITAIQTLEEVIAKLSSRGVAILLCEATPRVHAKLRAAGVLSHPADDRYCETLADALRRSGAA